MIIASFKYSGTVGAVQREDHHLSLKTLVTNGELTDDVSDESDDDSNYSNSCDDHDGDSGNEVGDADLNTISDDDKENESELKANNDVGREEDGTCLPHHLLQICHNLSDYVRLPFFYLYVVVCFLFVRVFTTSFVLQSCHSFILFIVLVYSYRYH